MSPLIATADQAVVLDAVETTMLADWSQYLTDGHSPAFVAGLIEAAVHYDPRLGLPMDRCDRRGCDLLVDDDARDEDGRLYCGPEHRDADHSDAYDAWVERTCLSGRLPYDADDPDLDLDGQWWDPGYGWRRTVSPTFPNS